MGGVARRGSATTRETYVRRWVGCLMVATVIGAVAVACGSDDNGRSGRTVGETGQSGGGASGDAAVTPSGRSGGSVTGSVSPIDELPTETTDAKAEACQELDLHFEPQIPTVMILVDRSSSMFDQKLWDPAKAAIEDVVGRLQDSVRFGFTTYSGINRAGTACPDLQGTVDFATDNARAIKTAYDAVKDPSSGPNGGKGETPTSYAIASAREALLADTTPGSRFIVLVTDGEPDYCDDVNQTCANDSTVYELQEAQRQRVTTFVFGLNPAGTTQVSASTLQMFANAGAGKPVANATPQQTFDQCNGIDRWKAAVPEGTLSRDGRQTLGEYVPSVNCGTPGGDSGTSGSCAEYYTPSAASKDALAEKLSNVLATVKSCTFDLQDKIEVKLDQLDGAAVTIQGQAVPLDPANGWRMNSKTQLELVGDGCTRWRDPTSIDIKFEFPCESIVIIQ